ncbi:rRNA maturation RNase YbeY [Patescibacteria group bacterium]|nr:rRNA maturation RNase YbeY [Patescibacteria group bacterium]
MNIEVNNLVQARVSNKFIYSILKKSYLFIKNKKKIDLLSVVLVNENTIKTINKKYRQQNRVTDILSFDDPAEIMICWKQLVQSAQEQKHSQKQELKILLIHGLLHILGYNHEQKIETKKMERMELKILSLVK